jgi:hypothetical protein
MGRNTEKDRHTLPPVCPGPYRVMLVIHALLAVWQCDECGSEWMVLVDQSPKKHS